MTFIICCRCRCSECSSQENGANRYCCREPEEDELKKRLEEVEGINCITQHPGYRALTENVTVLEVAYLDYRTHNEPRQLPLHK